MSLIKMYGLFSPSIFICFVPSFSLFKRELEKAAQVLQPHEYKELELWVERYITRHPHLIGVI